MRAEVYGCPAAGNDQCARVGFENYPRWFSRRYVLIGLNLPQLIKLSNVRAIVASKASLHDKMESISCRQ